MKQFFIAWLLGAIALAICQLLFPNYYRYDLFDAIYFLGMGMAMGKWILQNES